MNSIERFASAWRPKPADKTVLLVSTLFSGNSIGDEGAVALAGAIAPRPNADGSWGTGGLWAGGIGRGALASLNLQSTQRE